VAGYFFDSSAVVKRYLSETGSNWVRTILDPTVAHDIFLVKITGVEAVSAFIRQSPPLPPAVLVQMLTEFKYDMHVQYQLLNVTDAILSGRPRRNSSLARLRCGAACRSPGTCSDFNDHHTGNTYFRMLGCSLERRCPRGRSRN
jgi:hypothetical protein